MKKLLRILGLGLSVVAAIPAMELKPGALRTENQINPTGLDVAQPRFSWQLESPRRGDRQSAYRILAASSADLLRHGQGDLWDSGKIPTSETLQIPYAGKPLRSFQRAFWKVQVWDAEANQVRESPPATFELALLDANDWSGAWISQPDGGADDYFEDHPAPLFRKEFAPDAGKKIARARVYVSGLGYYELTLNGRRVGDHLLDPGWTTYSKRVLYSTYDITEQLRRGTNVLGIMLGNGWFNPAPLRLWGSLNLREHLTVGTPRARLLLRLEYADGTTSTIATDESWRVADGPLLRNNIYLGEVYDARRERPGWDAPGFNDSDWSSAVIAPGPPLGPLRAQRAPPIRLTKSFAPVKLSQPRPGVFLFDFGQNFAGWVRLRVKGAAGTRVRLRYGELLYPDGTLNGMTSVHGQIKAGGKDYRYDGNGAPKTAFQQDEYILKGDGEEIWTPRFTFHGFRYVELTGFPGPPNLHTLEALRLNSDVAPAGSFECSNEMLNSIQRMVLWTELSNLFSVQSDCPHREKLGYGGDMVASSEMALLNFDMANFYAKAVSDLTDAQRSNGGFTETAPFVGIADEGLGSGAGPIGWGTAQPLLLWQLYQYYGERDLLAENYGAAKNWIALLQSSAKDGILDNGIGDHESLGQKPRALTGTAFYYFNLQLFSRIARVLGRVADAQQAEQQAEVVKAAFNAKFLRPGTGRYDSASQACQAFALQFGLVPAAEMDQAVAVLTNDIAAHGNHLTTGIFGTKYLLNSLTEAGRADLAYAIVNQRTFPGWGFMLANGATTLWEHWEFSDNTYSHNHPMFGSVSEWFYKAIAGLQPAPDAVGFNKIIFRPQPVGDLTWAAAHYDSVRGRVATEWRRRGADFELHVTIPVGATARVFVPTRNIDTVRESGRPVRENELVEFIRATDSFVELEVSCGTYQFLSSTAR